MRAYANDLINKPTFIWVFAKDSFCLKVFVGLSVPRILHTQNTFLKTQYPFSAI